MNEENTVSYTKEQIEQMIAEGKGRTDWERVRSMTEEEVEANALSDPENLPLTDEELNGLQLVPSPKSVRSKLGLSQREFAQRFGLSKRTLEAWETGRFIPDQAAKTLLRVIAHAPKVVEDAVREKPRD